MEIRRSGYAHLGHTHHRYPLWRLSALIVISFLFGFHIFIVIVFFSSDGSMLAIAASYTFEEGEKNNVPEDNVHIHFVNDSDVRPRVKL